MRFFLNLRLRWLVLFLSLGLLAPSAVLAQSQATFPSKVRISTNLGDLEAELYPDKAPRTVANFVQYVQDKHYDGTIFHRVIAGFMVQGGGYDTNLREKPTRAPIPNEAKNGLKNRTYTIAMARTADPHSASAQFFINVNDNAFLDYPGQDGWGYAVFGKVISGMETVDKIKAVETDRRDKPKANVVIESAALIE